MSVVRTFLDLSTGHVPVTDRVLMSQLGPQALPVTAFAGPYGWVLHVPEERTVWEWTGTDALTVVLARAQRHGCDYVLLDADGPVDDTLPWFGEEL